MVAVGARADVVELVVLDRDGRKRRDKPASYVAMGSGCRCQPATSLSRRIAPSSLRFVVEHGEIKTLNLAV
jgi:hypothetical protein